MVQANAMYSLLTSAALVGLVKAGVPASYPAIPMRGVTSEVAMPLVGLGTWQYDNSKAEYAVSTALKLGYRAVDTALVYENHAGVGAALRSSGLGRDDYFVTSKIPGGLNASATLAAADRCLSELKLDYLDLMLIHFPASWEGQGGAALRKEEWLALEKWAKTGKARAIGVSHYCQAHLFDVLSVATVPVALNQVEYHIGMGSAGPDATDYKAYCQSQGVLYMSFSTLCGPCGAPGNTTLITGELVTQIGKAHNKSGPQVALRWAVQQGIPVVPKSANAKHQKSNLEIFDFALTAEEMATLNAVKEPAVTGGGDGRTSGDCAVKDLLVV